MFVMKQKYKNITIPYHYQTSKKYSDVYIYKNRYWTDLNALYTDFIGFYLDYHIEVKGKIVTVHSLEEVAKTLLLNYPDAKILPKYRKEYSENEYAYFEKMLNNIFKVKDQKTTSLNSEKISFNLKDYWWYKANKEIKKEQKEDLLYQTYSKIYKENIWVLNGKIMPLLRAMEEILNTSFYYQYGGDGKDEYSNHEHQHDFESIIKDVYYFGKDFIIYDFQKKFFSKQELKFLSALKEKLISLGYKQTKELKDSDNLYYSDLSQEYWALKDHKKNLQAFFILNKIKNQKKKSIKEDLKNHKL